MALTKEKIVSVLVFCAMVLASMTILQSTGIPPANMFLGLVGALGGLTLIWFAEPLGEIACFARGIAVHSPPLLIEAFGWVFLVGYPALLICLAR